MNRSDRRRWTRALLRLVLLIGVSQTALAHAILTESTPRLNSTVKGPEVAILLRFNVRIDSSRSRLHLIAPDESVVTLAMAKPPSPDCLKSTATGLRPGGYTLKWQVLASDGHMSAGEIPFTVN
jgi:methionine-rich copper-binding protein CopC